MPESRPVKPPARRGRPRSATARRRVLAAARALIEAHGPTGVTIEAVAARSGVGKPTIYRTWPNAHAVVMAALMDEAAVPPAARRRQSPLAALRRQLRAIATTFAASTGRNVTMMLAASEPDTELAKAFRHHFILARRDEGRQMLEEAVAAREVRAGLDIEIALELLYGPIFFRVLVGHAAVGERFGDALLDQLLKGWAPRRATR